MIRIVVTCLWCDQVTEVSFEVFSGYEAFIHTISHILVTEKVIDPHKLKVVHCPWCPKEKGGSS